MYVIEFRNGTFFQSLEADHGGPLASAQRFGSEQEAKMFCHRHMWILLNGGMVMAEPSNAQTTNKKGL